VARSGDQTRTLDARLKRLAENIETLAQKDQSLMVRAREIQAVRRIAAERLYRICGDFVAAVNSLVTNGEVVLSPASSDDDTFDENAVNMIQINVRGRILQVEFEATPELVSTEDFRIPYTLHGTVRAFNQQLLDKDLIEEQLIFYTVDRGRTMWRFFDGRTYRSGPFDQEYLVTLMEQII